MTARGIWLTVFLALPTVCVGSAHAALVDWNIDSSASYVRLTIPDSQTALDVVGNTTTRVRNAGSTTAWTDAGGARAFFAGTLQTNLAGGLAPTAITFLPGGNTLQAVDDKLLRPDPETWDGTDFADGETASAALGGRIRGTVQAIINFDAAYFSMSQLAFDISGGGALLANSLPGGSTSFEAASGLLAVDGLYVSLAGIEFPSTLGAVPAFGGVNNGAIALENVGGDDWKLTYSISLPIAIPINALGITLNGSAAGQIVAFATLVVPEPSSLFLAGVAAVVICSIGRRRSA